MHLHFDHHLSALSVDTICVASFRATINKEHSKVMAALCEELWRGDGVDVRLVEDAGQRLGHGSALTELHIALFVLTMGIVFFFCNECNWASFRPDDVRKHVYDIFDYSTERCFRDKRNDPSVTPSLSCSSNSHSSSCSDHQLWLNALWLIASKHYLDG